MVQHVKLSTHIRVLAAPFLIECTWNTMEWLRWLALCHLHKRLRRSFRFLASAWLIFKAKSLFWEWISWWKIPFSDFLFLYQISLLFHVFSLWYLVIFTMEISQSFIKFIPRHVFFCSYCERLDELISKYQKWINIKIPKQFTDSIWSQITDSMWS